MQRLKALGVKEQTVLSWNNMPEYAPFLSCERPGLLVSGCKCVFSVPKSQM